MLTLRPDVPAGLLQALQERSVAGLRNAVTGGERCHHADAPHARSACCARAVSGHIAAAPPSSVMNSRRLISGLPLQSRSTARSACHRAAGESFRAT